MELFRVRLNCIDSYQATPTIFDPLLRNNVAPSQKHLEPKVPVIRVFGATETGQKVCAHIHGAFPYLYIEYTGNLNPDDVGAYIYRLHLSIDHALAVSYRRNMYDGKSKFVARVTLVKGIPFYGYHVGYRYFLKIYMLNPMYMTRLADLLRQGVVMKKVFQPFEAHLQYLLQWMADYNLYGCGYIDCRKVTFRPHVPKYEDMDNSTHLWHDRSIPLECISTENDLPRVSHCSIEVDICVKDIVNRNDIKPRDLHHDFIERLNPLAPDEKLVHSMAGLWRDETRRRKAQMVNPDPGSSPFPPEVLVSMSADTRSSQMSGWIHEEECMKQVKDLILEERNKGNGSKISFDTFVKRTPFTDTIKTTLQAVEDLYPENLVPALGLKYDGGMPAVGTKLKTEDLDVDENRLFDFNIEDLEDFPSDSDEDAMQATELSQRKARDKVEEAHVNAMGEDQTNYDVDDEIGPRSEHNARTGIESFERYDGTVSNEAVHQQQSLSPPPQHEGFVRTELPVGAPVTDLKRSRSGYSFVGSYSKRQRIEVEPQGFRGVEMTGSSGGQRSVKTTVNQIATKSGQTRSRSAASEPPEKLNSPFLTEYASPPKQTSPIRHKPSLKSTLHGFGLPVVKDPHNPSTVFRLSQKSASQKSMDSSSPTKASPGTSSPVKHVSFDPSNLKCHSPQKVASIHTSSQSPNASSSTSSIRMLNKVASGLISSAQNTVLVFAEVPPTCQQVEATMQKNGMPQVVYQDAFYSNEMDVPERAREWAGREFKLESNTVPFLPDFDPTGTSLATYGAKPGVVLDKTREEKEYQQRRRACKIRSWEIAEPPPTNSEVTTWLKAEDDRQRLNTAKHRIFSAKTAQSHRKGKLSQIDGPTQHGKHGFKYTQNKKTTSVQHEVQYMSIMSLEVHVNTRGSFVPNPEEDEIKSVFWCLQSDKDGPESNGISENTHIGIIALSEDGSMAHKIRSQVAVEVTEETSELDVLVRMVEIVRTYDPDILTGYEVHGGSWGYLIERARLKYDYNLCDEFSRMKSQSHGRFGKDNDKWGFNNTSTIRVTGRHMINIWRAMRAELNLLQYTMENVTFHLLHRRIPHYSYQDLTKWYTDGKPRDLAKILSYYVPRVQLDLEILEQNELVPRTSEQARLLGVDFFSVFSRGSQFKVESIMFRLAKPENFLLISPSRKQVGGQNALECLPLVMEPQSAFYSSPLLVLDFQSLYPSVMIAYNYCYSTFLGRVTNWRGQNKMGFTDFKREERLLELLKDHINISPNGMMYVKPEIRKSLLAKMLGEILETRVMVKSGMKVEKDDKSLQRLLNNRQLALKLIANVTYGYTSASFSGRMPCSEIADSIVQTGRETLEKAIALIHSVKRWGAEVVYGDTDSLFVYLKGRTKDQAFNIGTEIAKTITNTNPRPVKLKFEKVYYPCVLLAKKRYVGFKYESRDQLVPEFDAKGIETVRRDGTPAEQKIEEKALKLLFRTADLSQVKSYFQSQCEKIMRGSVSIQDFCFAREVKLGTYSEKGPPPPGALISTRRMLADPRSEPQYGERVPYVVITGAPGARLIDRCVAPETLLTSDHNELDAEYYISKNLIPPLERIFNLMGANVRAWYDEMPKIQRIRQVDASLQFGNQNRWNNKKTLESYMKSSACLVCRTKLEPPNPADTNNVSLPICTNCLTHRAISMLTLRNRLSIEEKKLQDVDRVCRSCSALAFGDEVRCDSKDCPVFYTRVRQRTRLGREKGVVEPVLKVLQGMTIQLEDLEW